MLFKSIRILLLTSGLLGLSPNILNAQTLIGDETEPVVGEAPTGLVSEAPLCPPLLCTGNFNAEPIHFQILPNNLQQPDDGTVVIDYDPAKRRGDRFRVNVLIKNEDPVGCAASTYSIESAGAIRRISPFENQIIVEPGQTGVMEMQLAVANDAPEGVQPLMISAKNLKSGFSKLLLDENWDMLAVDRVTVDQTHQPDIIVSEPLVRILQSSNSLNQSITLPFDYSRLEIELSTEKEWEACFATRNGYPCSDQIGVFQTKAILNGIVVIDMSQTPGWEWLYPGRKGQWGNFSARLSLKPGPYEIGGFKPGMNKLVFESIDLAGNKVQQTLNICYPFNSDGSAHSCSAGGSGGGSRTSALKLRALRAARR